MDLLAPLGPVFQGGTFSGNPLSMRAGLETVTQLEKPGFYEALHDAVQLLIAPIQNYIHKRNLPVHLAQVGSAFSLFFGKNRVRGWSDIASIDRGAFQRFFHFLLKHGIFISPSPYESCFISAVHTQEHLEHTRDCMLRFLELEF